MDPIWYTIRTIVSVVMAGIGGLLLWAAYLVSGNVTGAAIAWMVLLAAAIPAGFFAMFTIVGWQRSTAAQAKPSPLVAWCGDPRRYAVLWLASDEARYITGVALPVDAGFCQKVGGTPLVLAE